MKIIISILTLIVLILPVTQEPEYKEGKSANDNQVSSSAEQWTQKKKLLAEDAESRNFFGCSVAVCGDYAIAGAEDAGGNGEQKGSAYIFYRNQGGANNWGQIKKLRASDGDLGDCFGLSVAISGDYAIVGAQHDDSAAGPKDSDDYTVCDFGSAYIFYRNHGGENNWGEVKKIMASDGADHDCFGSSVSVSGDYVIVGAFTKDDSDGKKNFDGAAYIFARNKGGADNWGQVQKLMALDNLEGGFFGKSVSISGDQAIVGASLKLFATGAAFIFSRNHGGEDNWGQVKRITAADPELDSFFGSSVSIDGDICVVGAHMSTDMEEKRGAAYIFAKDHGGLENWGQVKKLTASDGELENHFGVSVSINAFKVMVGAYYDNDKGPYSGSAYIFAKSEGGAGNWAQLQKLTASDGAEEDNFGRNVSISGDQAIVGACLSDDHGESTGSTYLFRYVPMSK